MKNIGHDLYEGITGLISKVKPPPKESKFYEKGILTPEEYVKAGDYLVMKCPTWKWCSAKENMVNKYLPKDKQYLLTRVRSKLRASDYLKKNNTKEKLIEGDWVDADLEFKPKTENKKTVALDLDDLEEKDKNKVEVAANLDDQDEDFVIEGEEEKPEPKKETKKDNDFEIVDEDDLKDKKEDAGVVKTREYEVTITYDLYFFVPRMWLMGYNEKGIPLTDEEMKEDVMPEYRNKTCTIETQPCTGLRNISVHPCRHSLLLQKMIKDFQNSGKKLEIEQSILLFLKFLQSVVPTVQYDFTMDISF
jgi:ubiquitin-like-conjugating enzyme ATG3